MFVDAPGRVSSQALGCGLTERVDLVAADASVLDADSVAALGLALGLALALALALGVDSVPSLSPDLAGAVVEVDTVVDLAVAPSPVLVVALPLAPAADRYCCHTLACALAAAVAALILDVDSVLDPVVVDGVSRVSVCVWWCDYRALQHGHAFCHGPDVVTWHSTDESIALRLTTMTRQLLQGPEEVTNFADDVFWRWRDLAAPAAMIPLNAP